ncbi:MAG: hypothetical protein A2231_02665 [Candidatus Firestonebacteria bacterium RIFOXYA2_FULL_40_8]|nr:MAG: hypothetical protein A2231_02665 [Candidatus Firestonebacteria bacterium RIFOXYA2_FULL_40_8]
MKKLKSGVFLLLFIIFICGTNYAAGIRLGISGAVKEKVKELDQKVREAKQQNVTMNTDTAGSVTFSSAALSGTVNPNGLNSTVYFEWGTTQTYGNTTARQSVGGGTTNINVNAALTNLSADTLYNYRIAVTNGAGTTYGSNQTFTTGPLVFALSGYRNSVFAFSEYQQHISYLGIQQIRLAGPDAAFWNIGDANKDGIPDPSFLSKIDGVITETVQLGLKITCIITLNSEAGNTFLNEGTANRTAYINFVKTIVERYDGDGVSDCSGSPRVTMWQVGNEPNAVGGAGVFLASEFAKMVSATVTAIRQSDSNALIALGGTFGTEQGGTGWETYYATVLQNLETGAPGQQLFNTVDIHLYGNAQGDYRRMVQDVNSFRTILAGYPQYRDVRIITTETGTYSGGDGGSCPPFQSESEEAANMVKRFVLNIASGVRQIHWARLIESPGTENKYFGHCGLIFDGTDDSGDTAHDRGAKLPKRIYYSYHLLTNALLMIDWSQSVSAQTLSPSINMYSYRFKRAGQADLIAVWWDYFSDGASFNDTRTINLNEWNLSESQINQIISAVTDINGNTRTVSVSGGSFSINGEPLLIELK